MLWQILETTAALMKAQSEEDAKGSNSANEARRWTGVRTIVEARSLLKSLFRAAAGHKAQVRARCCSLVIGRSISCGQLCLCVAPCSVRL